MRIKAIISAIEDFAPPALQESWDNTGVQVGEPMDECTGVLVCLDPTEAVIAEAVDRGCNLVVSHHPLIFKGLKRITSSTSTGRAVISAVRAGITVYSTHTALDSTVGGISYEMARMLGLEPLRVLEPKSGSLSRITATVARSQAEDTALALLDAGNADVDAVEAVSMKLEGGPDADIEGFDLASRESAEVSVTVNSWNVGATLKTLDGLGPGKEMSVKIEPLGNSDPSLGLGIIARAAEEIPMCAFAEKVKSTFGLKRLRISSGINPDAPVRTVALCGGSGGEFIPRAISAGADVYITADIRYHDFADHNADICLMDIGHQESEICAKDIFYSLLTKKIPNFAVYKSELEKNPVNYL